VRLMTTLIKNGTVIDPSAHIEAKLNPVLENGTVRELTTGEPDCDAVIDATGLIVAPGFIDIHMHEEPFRRPEDTLSDTILGKMLRMGVTTAVGGNCGDNSWNPLELLDYADTCGAPVNVAQFAGHGYYRHQAGHHDKYTKVTPEEREKLVQGLRTAVEGGCVGVSFGIRYVPGLDEAELLAAASVCRRSGKLISAHIRDDAAMVIPSLMELIRIGEKQGVPVQVSHIGSMGGFGQMAEMLRTIDLYRGNGMDITADCYPYYAFSTEIGTTTYDDGWLERYDCDYSALLICDGKYKGMRATKEIFEELRREAPDTITVCYVMKESDVDMALQHPGVMVASDGLLNGSQGHPRAAGTFPRFLRNYACSGRISMSEAISKLTTLQAKKLGLEKKGRLTAGADADLVLFDPARVRDTATFEDPAAIPEGIEYVFVGGELACRRGEILKGCCGKAVRKF